MRKKIGILVIIVICFITLIGLKNVNASTFQICYRTHVQNVGWQGFVKNGAMAGTSGRSLRLEGINIKLENQPYSGNVEYCTHVQNIGWQSFVKNGEMSGTTGKSLRLEAIKIRLTGELANRYDIYYRVHCQNIGWMNWAKNGESAGSAGYSLRLEAIEIVVVNKGSNPPTRSNVNYNKAFKCHQISYRTHVQNIGWQNYVYDGDMAGTSGRSLRLEGINIKLENQQYSGNIEYCTHVQNIGWQGFVKNGAMSGTSGRSLRLEAIKIRLTGEMANRYDIYYRVHCQNIGWMDWAKNGEAAGTAGYSYRLEGINIVLVDKGEKAPGSTSNCFKDYYNNKSEYKINYENLNKLKKSNNITVDVNNHTPFPNIVETHTDNYFVEYISDNVNIAKVDNAGNITGMSVGKTKITMNFRNKKNKQLIETCFANVNVIYNANAANEYKINYENLNQLKKSNNIDVYVYNHTSFPIIVESWNDNYSLEFISDNTNIAKVDNAGNITGISVGKTKITMNFRNKHNKQIIETCSANVNVSHEYYIDYYESNRIKNGNIFDVCVNEYVTFPSVVQGYDPDNYFKEFVSENANIVKVDSTGKMYGIKPGITKVTMNFKDKHNKKILETYSANINVYSNKKDYTLEVKPSDVEVEVGKSVHVNCIFSKNNIDESRIEIRESFGEGQCSIKRNSSLKDGFDVIGKAEGTKDYEIYDWNYNGIMATFRVIIKPSTDVSGVYFEKNNMEVHPNCAYDIGVTIKPENAKNRNVIWKSSNPEIVEISTTWLDSARIFVKKAGNVIITATTEEGSYTATCSLISTNIPVETIEMYSKSKEIERGKEYQLNAIIKPDDATNKNIKWSSSDNSVVTVSDEGKIKGIKKGSAIIYAESVDEQLKTECNVTVINPPLVASCTISHMTSTIQIGGLVMESQGIKVSTYVSGGSGEYTYSIKLYRDDILIGETDQNELSVSGYKKGSVYKAQLIVTDSEGVTKTDTKTLIAEE